jgi:uncharacterized membrane protein
MKTAVLIVFLLLSMTLVCAPYAEARGGGHGGHGGGFHGGGFRGGYDGRGAPMKTGEVS